MARRMFLALAGTTLFLTPQLWGEIKVVKE